MSDIIYMDDDLTVRQVHGDLALDAPFKNLGNPIDYVLRQKFRVLRVAYETTKPDIGDDYPEAAYADFKFCYDEGIQDIGGSVWEFTAVYAKLPASFSRPGGTFPYTFPSYVTGVTTTSRAPLSLTVDARIQYDFAVDAIAAMQPQRYLLASNGYDAIGPVGSPVVANLTTFSAATVPTLSQWLALVAAGTEIIPEASKTGIWMGNIYKRETIYIAAR